MQNSLVTTEFHAESDRFVQLFSHLVTGGNLILKVFSTKDAYMKIGLLSDTHGWLHPKVSSYFTNCEEIWHAGDIGDKIIVDQLNAICPVVRCVFGNIDDQPVRQICQDRLDFHCEAKHVAITHIGGYPPRYNKQSMQWIKAIKPDIFICGHSHILKIMKDRTQDLLYLNPGAAGYHGLHKTATIVRFEIEGTRIFNMEVIELGERGQLLNNL